MPALDQQDDYQNTVVTQADGSYTFVTYRELVTSDPNGEDFQFDGVESLQMQWVTSSTTADFVKHDLAGQYTLSLAGGAAGEDSASYIAATVAALACWAATVM